MGIQKSDVTLIIPTRERKEWVTDLLAQCTHRPLVFVVDRGRRHLDLPDDLQGAEVCECEPNCGAPKAAETAILACKTRFIAGHPDDVEYITPNWMEEAISVYEEKITEKLDGVVAMNDGIENGRIACIPLMTKRFYMDNCYPTPYRRYYQDTEWTSKATIQSRFAYAPKAIVKHLVVHSRNATDMAEDRAIFRSRMKEYRLPRAARGHRKLFIGLPIYGMVDPHFFRCFGILTADYAHSDVIIYPHCGDSLINRARNSITRLFLESDCTHLLFIDTDLIFANEHIKRILEHEEDIVGGVYCKKQEGDPQIVANALAGEPNVNKSNQHLVEVKYVGTGFMRISRVVFEKMIEAYGEDMKYKLDSDGKTVEHDFWRSAPYQYPDGSKRYLSEDWWFCQKAKDLGFKIWLDLACVLKHSGNAVYPLTYQEDKLFRRPAPVPVGSGSPLATCAGDGAVPMSPDPALDFKTYRERTLMGSMAGGRE